MDTPEPLDAETTRECIVCGKDAVTIDRNDSAMCARHASIFVTMDHRKSLSEKARVVR